MKLIDKLADGKTMRFILVVCCVLFTAAFIFSVVDAHIQREEIRYELGWIGKQLSSIKNNL